VLLLVLIVLVAGLVGFAPTIASTDWGRNRIVLLINDQIKGNVALGGLDLSWLGDSAVRDVAVQDPEGRECVSVGEVQIPGGLLRLLRDFYNVGQVTVTAPEVVLYIDEEGNFSLVEAFDPKEPSPPKKPSPIRLPDAELVITGGKVRIVRPGAAEYVVPKLDLHAKTDPAGAVKANFDVALADGSALKGDIDVQDLLADGKLQLDEVRGKAHVVTEGALDLKPLGEALLGPGQLAGQATLDAKGEFAAGAITADVQGGVVGLQSGQVSAETVRPLDVQLVGQVRTDASQVGGQVQLKSTAGEISSQFDYSLAAAPAGASDEDLAATILAGRAPHLPDGKLTAQGRLDLVALADAVPALLRIRPGTKLTGGVFEIKQASATGGEAPAAAAEVAITGLAAVADGRNVQVDPITVQLDVAADAERHLQIRTAAVQAGFGKVTASGTPAALAGSFEADLARLEQQLGQIVELPVTQLVGTLSGRLETKRSNPERIDLALDAFGANVGFRSGDGQVAIGRLQAALAGAATLADGKLTRYEATRGEVDLDGRASATFAGTYEADRGGFAGEANVARADLAYLAQQLAGFGVTALAGYAGQLQMQARVSRADEGKPIQTQGNLRVQDVQLDGQALTPSVEATWTDLVYSPAEGLIRIPAAELKSAVANVTARQFEGRFGEAVQLAGDIDASADLAKTMAIVGRIAKMAEPPALAGQLALQTKCRTDGGVAAVAGSGRIENFRAGTDERIQPETVRFDVDAAVNTEAENIEIKKIVLDSAALAAQLAGRVQQYSGAQSLDVSGNYTLRWDRARDILFAFAPSAKGLVEVKGEHQGALKLAGPLAQPGATPAWRGLEGGLDLSWASAEVYGLPLSPAKFSPALKAAQIQLPTASIQAVGGAINVGGVLDLSGPEPILRLPPELAILANVQVTPELAEHVLSRFNPIFGKLARVQGQAGLRAHNVEMPLGDSLTSGGQGTGRLDLKDFRVQPSAGLLKLLVELGGLGTAEMYAVEVSGMDFVIEQGRIRYQDLSLRFAQNAFDLIFRGSVGFDDTLDLVVSVPVREQLLQRLSSGGKVLQYTKALEGLRVEIPIVGTRENPQLDFAKVDVRGLLERGLKGTVEQTGKEVLKGEGLGGLLDALGGQVPGTKTDPKAEPGAKTDKPAEPAGTPKPRVRPKRGDEPSPSPSPRPRPPRRRAQGSRGS
jgi:hypothetical protein